MTNGGPVTNASGPAVELTRVGVDLGGNRIVHNVDLDVACGEWLALLGPNGAGKTTLVRAIAGLVSHVGDIVIEGDAVGSLSARQLAGRLAVVPQQPVIPPGLGVLDYALLGRTAHQDLRFSVTDEDVRVATAVLQRLDVDTMIGRTVDSLSGGERQRVVIARALCQDADILVLDEPTTALDIGHQFEVLELVEELRDERGLTVISTIHDLGLAGQFADRCALLVDGQLVESGTPVEVLTAEIIARHYGVDADITVIGDRVDVSVRRRRGRDANDALGGTGADRRPDPFGGAVDSQGSGRLFSDGRATRGRRPDPDIANPATPKRETT